MTGSRQQDPAALKQLTLDLMVAINRHYMRSGTSAASICEVLNALACCTAVVFAGTRNDAIEIASARHFFETALAAQLGNRNLPNQETMQ